MDITKLNERIAEKLYDSATYELLGYNKDWVAGFCTTYEKIMEELEPYKNDIDDMKEAINDVKEIM